jgi:hypothetical protein
LFFRPVLSAAFIGGFVDASASAAPLVTVRIARALTCYRGLA